MRRQIAANAATTAMNTAAAANTVGSSVLTPNTNDAITRDSATAPNNPIATPSAVTSMPSRNTIRRIDPPSAPSAMRIPNSRLRSRTP